MKAKSQPAAKTNPSPEMTAKGPLEVAKATRPPRAKSLGEAFLEIAGAHVSETLENAKQAQALDMEARSSQAAERNQKTRERVSEEIDGITHDLKRRAARVLPVLAHAIATKQCGKQVAENGDSVVSLASIAMNTIPLSGRVTVHANPGDIAAMERSGTAIFGGQEGFLDYTLKENPQVERGGFVMYSETGVIDGQIKTQLTALARLFSGDGQ